MRDVQQAAEAVEQYADMIWRICLLYMKSGPDAQDIFQTVFLKYMLHAGVFQDAEHEKAWLIRVAVNCCKDAFRSFFRRSTVALEEALLLEGEEPGGPSPVLEAVSALPEKYRAVVYLHYYEGYTAPQVAGLLRLSENAVYTRLSRAREMLKQSLGGEALV